MGQGFKVRAKSGVKNAAEILIYEDVGAGWFGGVTAKGFADQLRELGDVSEIDVRINSYGGEVFDGHAIYSQLVQHKAKVTTYVDGVAASIASVIAMAGTEIHIAEAGFMMVHDAWGVTIGNAKQVREFADRLDVISGSIADVYVARTGQSANKIRELMAAETWLASSDALKYGFATKIVENQKVAAAARGVPAPAFDAARYNYHATPAALASKGRPNFDAARARLDAQRAGHIAKTLKRA